jgi:TolB-like protein/Tfp pilus assembly protein PilF/tRNA A-37 threonylcarbamoyl transferase component Bud32
VTLAAGTKLGSYEILSPLGKGGMGEVYRAKDVRVDRVVALKVLPEEFFESEERRGRFEREAKLLASLNHPGIATLYSFEEIFSSSSSSSSVSRHVLVMELVEGEGLDARAAAGPLPLEETLSFARQIAEALEAAHEKGIVHRDLKPANVMVTKNGRVKVLDFGLAKIAASGDGAQVDSELATDMRTQEGVVVGTVPYMSPEQAQGRQLDHRTDIFSLGVIVYELATGQRPFRGDSSAELLSSILRDTPRPAGELRPGLPAGLDRLIGRCLEKDRDQRYATARELAADLGELQRDPTSPTRPAAAAPLRAPKKLVLAGVAGLVVLLAAGAFVAIRRAARGASIESVAVLPFENATGDPAIEYLSDGISESLISTLSRLPGLRVISRRSAFSFKGKKVDPKEIGRQLGVDALLLGSLALRGTDLAITAELVSVRDDTQLWGEKYNRRADDVLRVEGEIAATIARTLRRTLSGEEKAKLARGRTEDPEAYRLYLKGRDYLVGNQQEMDKSVDYFQQAVARAPEYALAHAGLAEAYTRQAFLRGSGRAEPASKARAAVSRALEIDPDQAEAHAVLGLVAFYFEWDWAGAETEFRRALELNPGSRTVQGHYGWFLTAMGRLDEGLAHCKKAAELDPLSTGPVHDIAINYMARGDLEQAAATFRRAIDIDPNWTWGYIKLGRTLARQKKCGEALAQTEISERRIAGGAAPLSRSWLGVTYALCGEPARARQKLDELHALEAKQYVDPVNFADIHSALGETDEAMRWYEKAFEDRTPNTAYASIMPLLDPGLAGNKRYEAIVRKMNFPVPAR